MGEQEEQSGGSIPPQTQERQPGVTYEMDPMPEDHARGYKPAGKLEGKVALVTGGDSGIGRSVAVHFAKEGADIVISYLDEHADAEETKRMVESEGQKCEIIPGDIGDESICRSLVDHTVRSFGKVDVLVNNAAEQHPQSKIEDISAEQLERTFRTNIFAMFYLVKAAIPHMAEGGTIVNCASVTAYKGSAELIDYSATKGAIVAFTRSLSQNLAEKKIRVNAVAPGPIWTPLIPSTFDEEKVGSFGQNTALQRAGQPDEVAPAFVFLASSDSSYMTGQVLHPNGGEVVNG
jgi:NAD(P)-dependent dehydrogenase (short-subunit alcohol dehydrogenase family)